MGSPDLSKSSAHFIRGRLYVFIFYKSRPTDRQFAELIEKMKSFGTIEMKGIVDDVPLRR